MGTGPDEPLRLAAPSLRSVVRIIATVVGSALAMYVVCACATSSGSW
jgi:hypothetical protein